MSARFYSTEEVATKTGLSLYSVHRARATGMLPHHKVGNLVRFTDAGIEEFQRRTRIAEQPAAMVTTRRKRRRTA